MSQKGNYLPADFFDDFSGRHGSSKGKSRKYERDARRVKKSNTIKWDEKYDWILSTDELVAFEAIRRAYMNSE